MKMQASHGGAQAVFEDAATHGALLYRQMHQGRELTPEALYDLLMRMLLDVTHPGAWNAGYITGWYRACYGAEELATEPVLMGGPPR